jgi:hypothetical protein
MGDDTQLVQGDNQFEIGLKLREIMREVDRARNPVIRELLRSEALRVLQHAKFASAAEEDIARAA